MTEFTNYLELEILDHIFGGGGGAAYTPVSTIYLALYSTTCSDSARGTEISTGSYARQATAFGTAAAGTISNTAAESFTPSGANYGTVVATGLEDALSSGNQLCFDNDFTDTTVNNGDTLTFAIGDIDVTLD